MSIRIDIVMRFYDAINRNDMQAVIQDFDTAVVRNEFEGTPMAGAYRGIAEVHDNIKQGRGTWAEGRCDPEDVFENGDAVVVFVHARVRKHDSTEWTGGRFADGFVVRDGKVVAFHSFAQRPEALVWAGIKD
jgi:hypothetical protein